MSAELYRQNAAMATVLRHMAAGYSVYVFSLGEDGGDGYSIETETRDGRYIEVTESSIPLCCIGIADALRGKL